MLIRDIQLNINMEERPGYQFCQLAKEIKNTCDPHKDGWRSDGLEKARDKHAELNKKLALLELNMSLEEASRNEKPFKISEENYSKIRELKHDVSEAKATLDALEVKYNEDKSKLPDKRRQIEELANAERGRLQEARGKRIEEDNKKYNDLDAEYKDLTTQAAELRLKISKSACSCFPCCVAHDEAELQTIIQRQGLITQEKIEKKPALEIKPTIDLEKEFTTIEKESKELASSYLTAKEQTEKKRDAAKSKWLDLKLEIEDDRSSYYSKVSYMNMAQYRDVRNCILKYQEIINELYEAMLNDKKSEPTATEQARHPHDSFVRVTQFKNLLIGYQIKLNQTFEKLVGLPPPKIIFPSITKPTQVLFPSAPIVPIPAGGSIVSRSIIFGAVERKVI